MKYDSRELNFFVLNMIQENWTFLFWIWFKRIEPFFFVLNLIQRMELLWVLLKVFQKWFEDFFRKNDWKNWTFLRHMTQRIDPFFWTYVQKLIFISMIHRIEPSLHDWKNWTFFIMSKNGTFFSWIWRKELNLFFLTVTNRIELFFENISKNWTLFCLNVSRVELFFWMGSKDLNPLLNMFPWTEPFLFYMTQRLEPSFYMTQWLEPLL